MQDSVYGNTYDGDYYQTTEDTTITGTVLCDTFNDLSDATLGKITTVAGNNGDDVFNITGDLGTAINGDAGNDIFNVNTRATVTSINGGDGTDTLHVTDGSNVTFRAVENIVLNHDANPQEAIHLTIDGTTEVTDIKGFDGALGDRLKIASGDANVTLTGSAAVELAGSSSYLELTDVNDLTLKDFTTTAPVEFDFRYSWDGFTFGNLKIDGSLATHALTFKGCLGSDIARGGTFIGGKGDDTFIVGTLYSGDTVTGGEGKDTFDVRNSTVRSFSTIEDFTTGEDKIICGTVTVLDTSRFNKPLKDPLPTDAFKTLTDTNPGTAYLVQYNDVTCLVVTQGKEYAEDDVVVKLVGVEPDGITLDDLQ